jgi:peptidyl-tRNA hydrolase
MSSLPKLNQIASNLTSVTLCLTDKFDLLPYHVTFYFSYETCVAYHLEEKGLTLSDNVWSNTTGKHIGIIADIFKVNRKDKTIPYDDFKHKLNQLFY